MTPPKRGKFPKNIPYHDVFMGTLPSSRRGKCVTLFGGARAPSSRETYCGASRLRSECTLGYLRTVLPMHFDSYRCTDVSQSVHLNQRIIVARPFAG
ncbi:hypothetical protein TNCV_3942951 [Trichonephila clavipes]|nr:hypothetical protein TNCV_3942951 [Trichonephila clavipes]